VDRRQQRSHDERRVLSAELAVDRAGERLGEELALAEGGQRVEVALLLLRRRRGSELLRELVVARGVARVGQHADDRREHVGVEVGGRPGVELGGARLHLPIVAERAHRANQIAAELARELVFSGSRRPAELAEDRAHAVADERGEPRPIVGLDDAIQGRE